MGGDVERLDDVFGDGDERQATHTPLPPIPICHRMLCVVLCGGCLGPVCARPACCAGTPVRNERSNEGLRVWVVLGRVDASVSRGHPFKTVHLPLSYSGNPGVHSVSYRGARTQ